MKRKQQAIVLAGVMLAIALAIMITQWIAWPGHWWDWEQVLHHENCALFLIAVAIGIGISLAVTKTR